METKFTKGEWNAVDYSGYWCIQKEPYYTDKDNLLDEDSVGEEAQANAKLIAAAPELLTALSWLLDAIPSQDNDQDWWPDELTTAVKNAEYAITKATE